MKEILVLGWSKLEIISNWISFYRILKLVSVSQWYTNSEYIFPKLNLLIVYFTLFQNLTMWELKIKTSLNIKQ